MNQKFKLSAPVVFLLLAISSRGAAPVVSNVSVQQRSGTELVDINYTLSLDSSSSATVRMWFSSDNGANFTIKCESITGDVGQGISEGNRSAVWDGGTDWNNKFTNFGKIRVIARNGDLEPELNSTLSGISDSAPLVIWNKTFGGNENDQLRDIQILADGSTIISGQTFSDAIGDVSDSSKGATDGWIMKLDASGNKLWDKRIGGAGNDRFHSVLTSADGGFVFIGDSASDASGDKTDDRFGGWDYWLVKVDSNGSKLWDKTIGGENGDLTPVMTSSLEGGYVVAGRSSSNINGSKSEACKGDGADYWVIKFDADGKKLWDKTLGGSGSERPMSIKATLDDGYIIAGYSDSNASFDKSEDSKGGNDCWIVKIDADGKKIWDKTLGGPGSDSAYSIATTLDGSFVIAGNSESNSSGDKTLDSKGGKDFWIVKLDSSGNKLWDKTIGGYGNDVASSLSVYQDGSFIVAGWSDSNASGDKTLDSKGGKDFWIVKLAANGNKLWDKTIGGSGEDSDPKIISGLDGSFYIAGQSDSNSTGDKSQESKGLSDYWIIKLEAEL